MEEFLTGGCERILLVDDEAAIIEMEKRIFKRPGYDVTAFTSSIESFETFLVNPDRFDLVITDMAKKIREALDGEQPDENSRPID